MLYTFSEIQIDFFNLALYCKKLFIPIVREIRSQSFSYFFIEFYITPCSLFYLTPKKYLLEFNFLHFHGRNQTFFRLSTDVSIQHFYSSKLLPHLRDEKE